MINLFGESLCYMDAKKKIFLITQASAQCQWRLYVRITRTTKNKYERLICDNDQYVDVLRKNPIIELKRNKKKKTKTTLETGIELDEEKKTKNDKLLLDKTVKFNTAKDEWTNTANFN